MKNYARNAYCLLAVSIFCSIIFTLALVLRFPYWQSHAGVALAVGLICIFFQRTVCKKWRLALLIVENQILRIQTAILHKRDSRKQIDCGTCETMEIFVSCFGILLGSKIIKFNQDGIQLRAVEIGQDYLSVDYGTETYIGNIRLLYVRPEGMSLADIIEKFRYETGIIPVINQ